MANLNLIGGEFFNQLDQNRRANQLNQLQVDALRRQQLEHNNADTLAGKLASIQSEPTPIAPAPTTQPVFGQNSNDITTSPNITDAATNQALGIPSPNPPASSDISTQAAMQIPTGQSALQSVTAPPDTRAARTSALMASDTGPGTGEMKLNYMAGQNKLNFESAKYQGDLQDKALAAYMNNPEEGLVYAQMHGLTDVQQMFAQPKFKQFIGTMSILTQGNKYFKDDATKVKFASEALGNLKSGMSQNDAIVNAYMTPGLVQPEVKSSFTNDVGAVTQTDKFGNVINKTAPGVGKSNSVLLRSQLAKLQPNKVQSTYTAADGTRHMTMKDGTDQQAVDQDGNAIQSSEIRKFAGQIYLKNAGMPGNTIGSAQGTASQLFGGNNQQTPNKVLNFVPGQGFITADQQQPDQSQE
jgi:hypothetical protein